MKKGDRLCVVMPVYNEQDAIGPVLEKWDVALSRLGVDYEIRPYNDGSRDNSLDVMRKVAAKATGSVRVIDKKNGGHGNTILTGYRDAVRDGFDWVFQVDSDDEMQPDGFAELWRRRNDFDFLVGARAGRVQALPRKVVSFVSRLCTRLFYGKGVWDVNSPYRLMRISAFREFFENIPLTTFAPNVILSGLAARHSLRCFETKVPQRDRTTGEVSIKKWKLLRAAVKSLGQTVRYAVCENRGCRFASDWKWYKLGFLWLAAIAVFACVPGVFFNWNYNYISFLPVWCAMAVFFICMVVLVGPLKWKMPSLMLCPIVRLIGLSVVVCALMVCFWVFRTRVHCFCGDGCVGTVPQDLSIRFEDFLPAMPFAGRLDGWGSALLMKMLLRTGALCHFTGMTVRFAAQVYTVVFGCVYVLLAVLFFHKSAGALCALLTLPFVFNFFGNIDCYAFPLCVAVLFAAAVVACDKRSSAVGFARLSVAVLLWLVGLWAHPFFSFGGFFLIRPAVAFVNGIQRRVHFDKRILELMYAVCLFVAISFSQHAKPFFVWAQGQRPPVFSNDTLIHLLNVVLLPAAPLAIVAWSYAKNAEERSDALRVFALMAACFLPLGFTQGANDQFPYMHLLFFFSFPWVSVLARSVVPAAPCRFLLAANLFLLIPMVAVHCTEMTISRAERLYPLDPCKHNTEMSWQTHLGLLLADNMLDSCAVKSATLRTFANGARHAVPIGFRGGNFIYHTAFLYHFGEFSEGRRQLFSLLKENPQSVRWFVSLRPGFIYLNRKALWDDIDLFLSQTKSPMIDDYRKAVDGLREKASQERYCIKPPSYAHAEY